MASEKSFQLLRTNPALTGNVKVVVDSEYKLYLETYNSIPELTAPRYKHYIINEEDKYDISVSNFFEKTPTDLVFAVRDKEDVYSDIMYSTYINQYDAIYFAGATNIDDQWYNEEFEYHAPL